MQNDNKQTPLPPKFLLRLFKGFCRSEYHDDIEGDLLELFAERLREGTKVKANLYLFFDIFLLFRSGIIRPIPKIHPHQSLSMYRNYFKIGFRSLLKQKLYTAINIGGLAIGLTCFLIVFLYVQHEYTYDRFFPNSDRIYRIYQQQKENFHLGSNYFAVTPAGLASAMERELPEVQAASTFQAREALLEYGEKSYLEQGVVADPHFFEVFPYAFVEGVPATALSKPNSIVLTQSFSENVFGNQDPVGKAMIYQNGEVYLVSGIVKDPPSTSSLQFSHVASLISDPDYKREMEREKWNNHNYFTFFALKEHSDPSVLESKLPEIYNKYSGLDDTYSNKGTYYVQALRDLHLETGMNADLGSKGNIQYIRLFSLVALLILLLACINYTNLAIARSMRRAKEVGIRKTIGARFGQLMGQFLGESVLIAGLSLLFALVLTYFLLPVFGSIMGRSLEIHIQENPFLLLVLLGLVICVGLLAGSYPALVMSSLKPIQVLKGKIRERFSTSSFQKILIIGQYATSIAMIIGSIAIYQQFQFIKRKDLGYEKDHVLSIPISFRDNQLRESLATLKTDWLSHPQIEGVSTSGTLPIYVSSSTTINDDKGSPKDDDLVVYENRVDYDFLDLYNIPLLAGRNFSPDFPTDLEKGYILNETAAKSLGWTAQEAVGKHFTHMGEETVIGVVKDFHIHPMRMEIAPLMMLLNQGFYSFVSIKVRPDNLSQTLDFLKETFQANSPYPFEYSFLDARFNRLYQDDQRLGSILGFFTLLAFLVASLGLFGLAAFSATQRTKEIGIRKVMGATVKHIVRMLSVDFMRLVLVGFLIAIPIAWYAIHTWLEGFAYGIEMKWWVFGLVGLSAMLIAFLTISFQSIKAALMNPLECLVDE